jgi:CHAT domain-containing protein
LASLDQLLLLDLSGNEIEDLTPLAGLHNLKMLLLLQNQVTDIQPLNQLTQLTWVVLDGNQIVELPALEGLRSLISLDLQNNPLRDKRCPFQPATICIFSDDSGDVMAAADAAYAQGDYRAALDGYAQALATYQARGDTVKIGDALDRLGDTAARLGNYSDALRHHQDALALRQSLGDEPGIGESLVSLADLHERLGQYDEAIAQLDAAIMNATAQVDTIPIEGGVYQLPRDQGRLYLALARVELRRNQAALSLVAARQALQRFQQIPAAYPGQEDGERAAHIAIGAALLRQRDWGPARSTLETALEQARSHQDRGDEAQILALLGQGAIAQGQPATGTAQLQAAIAIYQALGDRPETARTLTQLGVALVAAEQPTAAIAPLQTAITLWESLRPGLTDAFKISLAETQTQTYQALQQAQLATGDPEGALETLERGRARAFVELIAARSGGVAPASPRAIAPPDRTAIRRIARDTQATLITYSWDARSLHIWVVSPSGEITVRSTPWATESLAATAAPDILQREIIALRGAITARPALGLDPTPSSQILYQRLIAPIADRLPTDPGSRLAIIPSGDLFLVPFAALQDPSGEPLIARYALISAPAIQVLDLSAQRRDQLRSQREVIPTVSAPAHPNGEALVNGGALVVGRDRALVLGNPTMPSLPPKIGAKPEPLAPLPGAEQEAIAVARLLQVNPLLGQTATKAQVRSQISTARWIHFATHGLLDDLGQRGMPGALALAPNQGDTGLLQANEILALPLQSELVVLSACNTGRGRITGDGIVGLSRAFVAAGAAGLVVTLWKIPDAATEVLMVEFYQNLANGLDKAEALRQAMLKTRAQFPHPVNWSAFVLAGTPD